MKTINLNEKFSLFSDYCNPRVIGEVNDCHVKAVKLGSERDTANEVPRSRCDRQRR